MGNKLETPTEASDCYQVSKYHYVWPISNFSSFKSKGIGYYMNSKAFYLATENGNESVHIVVYPNGYNERTKNCISVWLKKNSYEERLFKFTCSILTKKKKEICTKSIKQQMSLETYMGWTAFCSRSFLLNEDNHILESDTLHISCTLELYKEKVIANAENEMDDPGMLSLRTEMARDMQTLLSEDLFSDVKIKVGKDVFDVHKAILSTRSSVFKRMLKSKLHKSNIIEVTDISKDNVKLMLHYIYSGEVTSLDVPQAIELYYAADKYELHSLKKLCFKVLKSNLMVQNSICILLLGYRHSDEELQEECIQFIANNAWEIQESLEWAQLLKSHPDLVNRIFKRLSKK